MSTMVRHATAVVIVSVTVVTGADDAAPGATSAADSTIRLPAVTGPHGVGTFSSFWIDSAQARETCMSPSRDGGCDARSLVRPRACVKDDRVVMRSARFDRGELEDQNYFTCTFPLVHSMRPRGGMVVHDGTAPHMS